MRLLSVINLLNLLPQKSPQRGFTLLEVVIVSVIVAVLSVIAVPNLIASMRQATVDRTFSHLRWALEEAKVNANRLSTSCTVTIASDGTQVTGSPSGCILEIIAIDSSIVSVTTGNFEPLTSSTNTINFTYTGKTNDARTFWIARKDYGNNIINHSAKCIVVSSIGMIRTGIYNPSAPSNCENPENRRYDNNSK